MPFRAGCPHSVRMGRDRNTQLSYLPAEAKARVDIDSQLEAAGWAVQDRSEINLYASRGVAVREFTLKDGHGRVDYLLFVDRKAAGTIEAKPVGTTLTEVELQTARYLTGTPDGLPAVADPLPFAYESTGIETRFTNGLDPTPRSHRVFAFHQPDTLAGWIKDLDSNPSAPTVLARINQMPPLIDDHLWAVAKFGDPPRESRVSDDGDARFSLSCLANVDTFQMCGVRQDSRVLDEVSE
jgi:hypothetical protein